MTKKDLILTLGKLLIAAAWADGDLTQEEINSLKDLLFHLPSLNAEDWAILDMYIHSPVSPAERDRVLSTFLAELRSPGDKRLAIQALDNMLELDASIGDVQIDVMDAIKDAIENQRTGLGSLLGSALTTSLQRRQAAMADAPNREAHYEDFIKNRVFYSVQRMLESGDFEMTVPEERLRMLCLAGGLMARIAHVDEVTSPNEEQAMINALCTTLGTSKEEAAFITGVALSEIGARMDYYRLTREFFTCTSEEERLAFLEVLFSIADAESKVSHQEIEEIRAIARGLRLTHQQFIHAKLNIPAERRAS